MEKNLFPLPGIEPWPSSPQPITILTELSQLPSKQGGERKYNETIYNMPEDGYTRIWPKHVLIM
jgi:hypothetical protein